MSAAPQQQVRPGELCSHAQRYGSQRRGLRRRPPCPLLLRRRLAVAAEAAPGEAGSAQLAAGSTQHKGTGDHAALFLQTAGIPGSLPPRAHSAGEAQPAVSPATEAAAAPAPQDRHGRDARRRGKLPVGTNGWGPRGERQGPLFDQRITQLTKDLMLVAPRGAPQMRPLLVEAGLGNAEARQLLSCLVRHDAPEVALSAFRLMCEERQPAWSGDPVLYTQLMQAFVKRSGGGPQTALDIFAEMARDGVAPDVVAYNCALAAAGKASKWGELTSLLASMDRAGVRRDAFTYASLLHACQLSGRWRQALDVFAELEVQAEEEARQAERARQAQRAAAAAAAGGEAGAGSEVDEQQQGERRLLKPNAVHYTSLMVTLVRAGRWESALQAFDEMEARGVQPDTQAYNTAIAACAKGLAWEKGWAIFIAMQQEGLEPSAVSYNTLISACERCGQVERALEVFGNMKRQGVQPNTRTYNTLISACGKGRGGRYYERAVALHREMQGAGVPDDVFTLASLVVACEGAKRWHEALAFVEEFQQRGIQPNTVVYNALISALGVCGQWQVALDTFQAMQRGSGAGVAPDVVTYGSLIAALERSGQWQRALELYDEMQAKGLRANGYIVVSLLNACEKGGQWEKASELFRLAQELEFDMDSMNLVARTLLYTFPWLINSMPAPLVKAAQAAVESGRAVRRWVNKKQDTADA